jgi:hypothetical protein
MSFYKNSRNDSRNNLRSNSSNFDRNDYWDGIIDVHINEWLFDLHDFEKETPSRIQKISFQDEINKRVKGVSFIFNCCKQLRLSRSVGLTAATIFHRFYMFEDLKSYHYYEAATTALFVACKSEECRRNLKDVVKVCARVASGKSTPIDEDSKMYWKWKDLVVKAEELLLQKLNFDVSPINPYKLTTDVLKINIDSDIRTAPNKRWDEQSKILFGNCTYLFEIFARLPICLFYSPNCICALVTILGTKKLNITFPLDFIQAEFNVELDEIIKCYDTIISLATEVEIIDKYFRILPHIPRITPADIEIIYAGTNDSTMDLIPDIV